MMKHRNQQSYQPSLPNQAMFADSHSSALRIFKHGVSLFSFFYLALSFLSATVLAANPLSKNAQKDAASTNDLPPQFVILQYHHVASDTPPITSISPEDFASHMAYLSENHSVISLKEGIEAVQAGTALPSNAVAISFDDGYKNILTNAHPVLEKYNFPYTIFVNPQSIDNLANQLTWSQVKQMQGLADFANHTLDHLHLLNLQADESQDEWLGRIINNIEQAEAALEETLGYSYKWLAYPFGEYNKAIQKAVTDAGYIAFGQQSGAVSGFSDFSALPRFPAAGRYANLDTLKTKLRSLAMPVESHSPSEHVHQAGTKLSHVSFTLNPEAQALIDDISLSQFACYFKGERIVPQVDRTQAIKVSVSLEHRFTPGRVRINCTAPSKSQAQRFYWHSIAFFTPNEAGVFAD